MYENEYNYQNMYMKNFDTDMFDNTTCYNIQSSMYNSNSCMCGFDSNDNLFSGNPILAQSYVPWQTMNKTLKPCTGLKNGTIFPELVRPYRPCQDIEEINYIRATNTIKGGYNDGRE